MQTPRNTHFYNPELGGNELFEHRFVKKDPEAGKDRGKSPEAAPDKKEEEKKKKETADKSRADRVDLEKTLKQWLPKEFSEWTDKITNFIMENRDENGWMGDIADWIYKALVDDKLEVARKGDNKEKDKGKKKDEEAAKKKKEAEEKAKHEKEAAEAKRKQEIIGAMEGAGLLIPNGEAGFKGALEKVQGDKAPGRDFDSAKVLAAYQDAGNTEKYNAAAQDLLYFTDYHATKLDGYVRKLKPPRNRKPVKEYLDAYKQFMKDTDISSVRKATPDQAKALLEKMPRMSEAVQNAITGTGIEKYFTYMRLTQTLGAKHFESKAAESKPSAKPAAPDKDAAKAAPEEGPAEKRPGIDPESASAYAGQKIEIPEGQEAKIDFLLNIPNNDKQAKVEIKIKNKDATISIEHGGKTVSYKLDNTEDARFTSITIPALSSNGLVDFEGIKWGISGNKYMKIADFEKALLDMATAKTKIEVSTVDEEGNPRDEKAVFNKQ